MYWRNDGFIIIYCHALSLLSASGVQDDRTQFALLHYRCIRRCPHCAARDILIDCLFTDRGMLGTSAPTALNCHQCRSVDSWTSIPASNTSHNSTRNYVTRLTNACQYATELIFKMMLSTSLEVNAICKTSASSSQHLRLQEHAAFGFMAKRVVYK